MDRSVCARLPSFSFVCFSDAGQLVQDTHLMDTAAAASIVFTTALTLAFDWIPTSLNRNILYSSTQDRLLSSLVHGTLGVILATSLFFHLHWAALISATWFTIILVSAAVNWWLPYVFGVYWGEITVETYMIEFSDNLTLLAPLHKDNVIVPDVQHTLLHTSAVLSLTTSVAVLVNLLST
ncbi:Aste57867_19489 [Aphanomyces stellatus]|uniref:Aste57867_19489 protein n=1 Tax=Aphanomyces stellatus TaxID=120398 RepID=A0A485LEC5_9STRA|nr:hypothetical protein As57867_019425 [Aphanomyces stellatus]VFT96200.1 Aste57867_19489 [Aphanomyces stellatus]